MKRLSKLIFTASFVLSMAAVAQAASDFPTRALKLVVPGAPGGGGDLVGRLLADGLAQHLNQPIIVENNAGASGTIATNQVVKAKPDGYTIGLGLFTPTILAPAIFSKLPYDPLKDLTIVSGIGSSPIMLVVNNDVPANNLQEFLEYARKSPEPLQYGSWGIGSTGHFCGEILSQKTGIKLEHIPYKGAAPVILAMLGGEIQAALIDVATGTAPVQNGKIKPLAMCTRRTESFPNVPTYKEQGIDFDQWTGWTLIAPVGIEKSRLETISEALRETLKNPEVVNKLLGWGITAHYLTGEEQLAINRRSIPIWKKVADNAGMPKQ